MCWKQNEKCICPDFAGIAVLGFSQQSCGSPDQHPPVQAGTVLTTAKQRGKKSPDQTPNAEGVKRS